MRDYQNSPNRSCRGLRRGLVCALGLATVCLAHAGGAREPSSFREIPRTSVERGERTAREPQPNADRFEPRRSSRDIQLTGAELESPADPRRLVDERPPPDARPKASASHVSPRGQDRPLALAPPNSSHQESGRPSRTSGSPRAITTVVTSLSVVLGAFALLVWFSRRTLPGGLQRLPNEVVQLLGRSPLDTRHQLQLLKVGNKLLLLNVSAGGAETLTEITDPEEVNRLTSLCLQHQPNSVSNTFREVLSQLGEERQRAALPGNGGIAEPGAGGRSMARRRGEGSVHG